MPEPEAPSFNSVRTYPKETFEYSKETYTSQKEAHSHTCGRQVRALRPGITPMLSAKWLARRELQVPQKSLAKTRRAFSKSLLIPNETYSRAL